MLYHQSNQLSLEIQIKSDMNSVATLAIKRLSSPGTLLKSQGRICSRPFSFSVVCWRSQKSKVDGTKWYDLWLPPLSDQQYYSLHHHLLLIKRLWLTQPRENYKLRKVRF